jgi:hypothetical protein
VRAVLIAAVVLTLSPAAAHASSFSGSCALSGTVLFSPPMTTTPQSISQSADATGTCNGKPARYRASSSGDNVSCAFGLDTGSGVLRIGRSRIAFTMSEYRGGATPLIHLTGRRGGEAWMAVTPSQDSDPLAAVQACNGAGLEAFALDAHLQTTEPLRG